jgi:hypothetical protein
LEYSKQKIEGAFNIITQYLKKPSSVWEIAPLSAKLKLQWFNFPKGISYDGQAFRTTEICNIFNTKDGISPPHSAWVTRIGFESQS